VAAPLAPEYRSEAQGQSRARSSEEDWSRSEGAKLFSLAERSTGDGRNLLEKAKSWSIPKRLVWEAYKRVKANLGAPGVDDQSIEEFEADLKSNLYKLWNRMSSGSYFLPPVKRVQIDMRDGGKRPLGIPTVSDRIAQVVKGYLEPELANHFHPDSYGYRRGKSALEAVGVNLGEPFGPPRRHPLLPARIMHSWATTGSPA